MKLFLILLSRSKLESITNRRDSYCKRARVSLKRSSSLERVYRRLMTFSGRRLRIIIVVDNLTFKYATEMNMSFFFYSITLCLLY